MNVVLKLKESQLQGVLEVLGKAGGTVDIVINIEDGESGKKVPDLTTENLYQLQEEVQKQQEEENKEGEVEQEEENKEGEVEQEEASKETNW